jgi:hypothetical protein
MKLGLVVEGHGEVEAAPLLVRRIAAWAGFEGELVIPPPLRVHRGSIVKDRELERAVELTARKVGEGGGILVLLDADDDLACQLGPDFSRRATEARSDRRIGVVFAVREYEAWFLAAADSLRGHRSLPADLTAPDDAEAIRGAKGWLDARMVNGYSETIDQAKLTARFDLDRARSGAPSFDKLIREICKLLQCEPASPRPA